MWKVFFSNGSGGSHGPVYCLSGDSGDSGLVAENSTSFVFFWSVWEAW